MNFTLNLVSFTPFDVMKHKTEILEFKTSLRMEICFIRVLRENGIDHEEEEHMVLFY